MSKLYNQIQSNINSINGIISNKIITERFEQSTTWVSPLSGQVTLYGVGKGQDGKYYELNHQYDEVISHDMCIPSGGMTVVPTKEIYTVTQGQSYEIKLFEEDSPPGSSDSLYCYFDGVVSLGHEYQKLQASNIYEEDARSRLGLSCVLDRIPPIMWIPPPQKGRGGMGIRGEIHVIDVYVVTYMGGRQSTFVKFEPVNIIEPATKGETGFLEISYPYQGNLLEMFEDEFAA